MILHRLFTMAFMVSFGLCAHAQSGIGTVTPDASSLLDLSATNKGLLIPRMTAAQRDSIVNPAAGLQVYVKDSLPAIYYFNGSNWINSTYGLMVASGAGDVSTLAGTGTIGSADGAGTTASFRTLNGIASDAAGNLYVADADNNKIRKITPSGVVSTFAGSGTPAFADGPATTAAFNYPTSVALDAGGNVYVADYNNNRIRRITPAGNVTTIAGNGSYGFADGPALSASFAAPLGLATDPSGNLYIADADNNRIRKITGNTVSTLAGNGNSGSMDGAIANATFSTPTGIALDATGNMYIADMNNHKIRKITPTGNVSTLAGSGSYGSTDGQGTFASFSTPTSVAADAGGNIYVADGDNNKIRKITPTGIVTTFVGTGASGNTDGPAPGATFNAIYGVAVDATGNVYVTADNRVRKIARKTIFPAADPALLSQAGYVTTTGNQTVGGTKTFTSLIVTGAAALNGSGITNLNAASITPNGTLPALNGAALTNLNATAITSGSLDSGRLSLVPASKITGALPALNGNALTSLNAASLTGMINGPNMPDFATKDFNLNSKYDIVASGQHGIGWYGTGLTPPKVWDTTVANGIVVYGYNTGILGTSNLPKRTVLYWNSAGQVGIGTTTPSSLLHLKAFMAAELIVESSAPGGKQYGVRSQPGTAAIHASFQILDKGTGTCRIGIDSAGQVGIGTTNPTAMLSVNGTANNQGGSWGTYSDIRLKKNIKDYKPGLKEVMAIHPVSFQYNELSGYSDQEKRFVGVIAQEIEQVLPSTVTKLHSDPLVKDKRQYDNGELVYTLINAVKEQEAKIEALEKKNAGLQTENQRQSEMIDADHASLLTLQQQMEALLHPTTAGR